MLNTRTCHTDFTGVRLSANFQLEGTSCERELIGFLEEVLEYYVIKRLKVVVMVIIFE